MQLMNIIISQWKYFLLGIITFIAGFCLCYYVFPRTITQTDIQYVEKPIVTYVDRKVTDIQYIPKEVDFNGELEKTDVEMNIPPSNVIVKVNGKETKFELINNEEQKFDKGKLVINQEQKGEISIKVPIDQRKWNLKLGKSNHGVAGGLDYQAGHVIGAWSYFDKETQAGGISGKF